MVCLCISLSVLSLPLHLPPSLSLSLSLSHSLSFFLAGPPSPAPAPAPSPSLPGAGWCRHIESCELLPACAAHSVQLCDCVLGARHAQVSLRVHEPDSGSWSAGVTPCACVGLTLLLLSTPTDGTRRSQPGNARGHSCQCRCGVRRTDTSVLGHRPCTAPVVPGGRRCAGGHSARVDVQKARLGSV